MWWLVPFIIAYIVTLQLYPHDVVRAMAAGVIASLVYFLVSKVSDDLGA
jgi:uncharacterized protein (DUF2062 family)